MKWTQSQQTAIDLRDRTLLVSAAAGSGKTAVLTARIIARLTDPDDPADISRMLIVTFTKAAAAELRERISDALKKAVALHPDSRALAGQAAKLSKSKICTIHSFCYDAVRRGFEKLGLPARLRVADETEINLLASSVMNSVINSYYDAAEGETDIADFAAFTDIFVTERDDALSDILLAVYRRLLAYPQGIAFLTENTGSNGDYLASAAGKLILDRLEQMTAHYLAVFDAACDYFSDGAAFEKNYLPAFSSDRNFLLSVRAASAEGYDALRTSLSAYARVRLGSGVKKDAQTAEAIAFRDSRDDFNDEIKKFTARFFSFDSEAIKELDERGDAVKADTARILTAFDNAFSDEKRRRGIIDFTDLERLAYRLFVSDGKPTPAALETAAAFDEIYIDEYQDVNELQDRIFSAIASPRNRFMVGDVKQSIYGFRGAIPSIFSEYRDAFPLYNGSPSDANTVFLSDNFRCDRSIIDFSNLVFGCLFPNCSSGMTYYEQDRLNFAKADDGHVQSRVEVALLRKNSDGENYDNNDESDDNGDNAESDAEVAFVAARVGELLAAGYRPKDIVILMRSAKNSASRFEDAFKRLKIPYFNSVTRSFFENAEILLMLCLLNCIDNPTRDIYLTGALKSPVFNLTLDELVLIRAFSPDSSLYDALCVYTSETGFEKGEYFLAQLEKYREYSRAQPVDKLIWFIYRDTGLLSLVYDDDGNTGHNVRRANLMLLYDYARKFEASSFRGLYNFIRYVNDVISERESIETAKPVSESDDALRIMTVHQSKGLEFPVCFLCGADKSFNFRDSRDNLLFSRSLGMAVKLRDDTGFGRLDTPSHAAAVLDLRSETVDEEMRVLYVALTRARERLIVTAAVRDPEKLLDDCRRSADFVSVYSLAQSPSYIKWILTALANKNYESCCVLTLPQGVSGTAEFSSPPDNKKEPSGTVSELEDTIRERFSYAYPYARTVHIPAKLSVSKLYPSILDEEEPAAPLESVSRSMKELPAFMEEKSERASAAERGTATHVFMQFCDFSAAERLGARVELARLTERGFITAHMAELVYLGQLDAFFKSPFYARVKRARRIWREVRFNIGLPADGFASDPALKNDLKNESILVQGVIDCFFIDEEDRLVLFDYKTDYVPCELSASDAASMLAERHRAQLGYYRDACARMAQRPVDETYIYSFALGREIKLDF